jgi:predicted HicB family RNase H-like nuclease
MPNSRAEGMVVRSYTVERELHAAAAEKACAEGMSLSDVIREALLSYLREEHRDR